MDILLIIFILLLLGWGFGTFLWAASGLIHILLVIAIIGIIWRLFFRGPNGPVL
jgi:hypothetical protein